MKIKSKNQLFFYVLFYCFSAVFLSTGRAYEKSSALFIPKRPNTEIEHQLWQSDIRVLKNSNNKSKDQLQQIIKQIRTLEFKSPVQTPALSSVAEPIDSEPNEISSGQESTQQQGQKTHQIEPKLGYEPISTQTLEIFEKLSQNPEQIHNPFELGEVLYRSGNLKEAALCYQYVLDSADPNTPVTQNTAWILFQIGNCLQNDDSATAMQMYRRLTVEYPDSPWADFARAKVQLIDWLLRDKPKMLIENGVSET